MEFLIISSTKMKVKLSYEEIKKYSLADIESERVDSDMRKGLWQLIDIAKERHGFSFGAEKLLVQFYKTDFGGELFITKLLKQTPKSEKLLEGASNVTLLREKQVIYRFYDADSVIRAIMSRGSEISCSFELYLSDDECYYLILTARGDSISDVICLSEYAEEVSDCLYASIIEHSRFLGSTAELSCFFADISNSVSTLDIKG